MFEKVNKYHPDKIADRIAGAIVDYAYELDKNPKIAVEVLIGHGQCFIIIETDLPSDYFNSGKISPMVNGIVGSNVALNVVCEPQDKHLSDNQKELHCGDNGIFCGMPINTEEYRLTSLVKYLESEYKSDGKYILDYNTLIACQSLCSTDDLSSKIKDKMSIIPRRIIVNPLGDWTGGINVDTGATNRKLGSDMGRAVTGGGLHGKDLSKADVSVNIYCHLMAQRLNSKVDAFCNIGAQYVKFTVNDSVFDIAFEEIVETARIYIKNIGGFEKLAEYGLIR